MVPLPFVLAALVQANAPVWSRDEVVSAVIRVSTGLVIAIVVYRLARRVPWPWPFRLRFAALHLVAAPLAALAWYASSVALEALVPGFTPEGRGIWRLLETLSLGSFFYAVLVGVSYAMEASGRAARAEATAARTQLAALRAQLHPHFLFNALHTIVQLIPADPARATEAAELVADLLRVTLEEQRDEVTLGDEWRFVSRYLAVERIRFGDRLVVRADVAADLLDERVPAFALQTLVENAVRHGAAPRVAATEVVVTAARRASELTLSVRNTGDGGPARAAGAGAGTGLARLRERIAVLYGGAARLVSRPDGDGGFEAVLVVPRHRGRES
ncbi:MAG TPA: sensor histidine kinase [Longimicrobiaceae bacterium]|nr:sensor histidine kinase [Longimicrobiaceae bacterium]